MFKKIIKNKLREYTKLSKNKDGDLVTELIRPCTNFISAKMNVSNIIFSKRCKIMKPESLVDLTIKYCENENDKNKSKSIYINKGFAVINFINKKTTVDIHKFSFSDPAFNNLSKKHIIKIYKEKNILQLRKEYEIEENHFHRKANVIRLVE